MNTFFLSEEWHDSPFYAGKQWTMCPSCDCSHYSHSLTTGENNFLLMSSITYLLESHIIVYIKAVYISVLYICFLWEYRCNIIQS